jgi:hypothetical protein
VTGFLVQQQRRTKLRLDTIASIDRKADGPWLGTGSFRTTVFQSGACRSAVASSGLIFAKLLGDSARPSLSMDGSVPATRYTRLVDQSYEITTPDTRIKNSGIAAHNPKTLCQFQFLALPFNPVLNQTCPRGNHRNTPASTSNAKTIVVAPVIDRPIERSSPDNPR